MQKWEYDYYRVNLSSEEFKEEWGPGPKDMLNYLGAEGWEVVEYKEYGVEPGFDPSAESIGNAIRRPLDRWCTVVLKRPMASLLVE